MENGLWRRIREKWENTTNCMVDRRWPQLEVLCALTSTPLPWICCHRLFIFIRICLLIWELSYSIGVTERRSGQWRALAGQCLTSSDMLEFLVLRATAAGAGRLFSSIQHFFFVFFFFYTHALLTIASGWVWIPAPAVCSLLIHTIRYVALWGYLVNGPFQPQPRTNHWRMHVCETILLQIPFTSRFDTVCCVHQQSAMLEHNNARTWMAELIRLLIRCNLPNHRSTAFCLNFTNIDKYWCWVLFLMLLVLR